METEKKQNAVAFLRPHAATGRALLSAVPRFPFTMLSGKPIPPLGQAWGNSCVQLPDGMPTTYENIFTGETIAADARRNLLLSKIFADFPVAILIHRA